MYFHFPCKERQSLECHTCRSIDPFGIGTIVDLTRYAMKRGIVAQSTGLPRFFVSETSIKRAWELS
jgi:hypothetical protein